MRKDGFGGRRTQCGPAHAQPGPWYGEGDPRHDPFARREDQEEVEDDIEHAHGHAHQARDAHVAAAPQHAPGQEVQLEGGQKEGKQEEIERRIAPDRLIAAQPAGQRAADGHADQRQQQAEEKRREERFAQHGPCIPHVARSDPVGHLHGEARCRGGAQPPEEPRGGRHQADRRRGLGPEVSHHRGVDILHDDGRELRDDGREAEPHRQAQLLGQRHRPAIADQGKQPGGLIGRSLHPLRF